MRETTTTRNSSTFACKVTVAGTYEWVLVGLHLNPPSNPLLGHGGCRLVIQVPVHASVPAVDGNGCQAKTYEYSFWSSFYCSLTLPAIAEMASLQLRTSAQLEATTVSGSYAQGMMSRHVVVVGRRIRNLFR